MPYDFCLNNCSVQIVDVSLSYDLTVRVCYREDGESPERCSCVV